MLKTNFFILFLLGLTFVAQGQKKSNNKEPQKSVVEKKEGAKADSTKGANEPKAYGDVITKKALTKRGLFDVHRIEEQVFWEIPDSLLNRDILVVNRISKAPAGLRPQVNIYAGDEISENVIRFEKGPFHRIFMKRMLFSEQSNDSTANGLYRSVLNSNLQPIVASFPIKAYGGDSSAHHSSVIDLTTFLQSENEILYFSPEARKGLSLGAVQNDKSYVESIKPFPINVEIKTVRTYQTANAAPNSVASTLPITYELNSSLLLLPKIPMKPRYADTRVGFFARGVIDFDTNPQGVKQQAFITRWRLEPKEEDRERYLKGELVEPKHPIVYYIDPATPKKWVPYLIAGINDWQQAFEQAGFKHAIRALPAPENDSTWSIDDARHNVLVYKPSAIANASGPHVHDPRSGEIMETHINWYHNIMSLVRNWYMIQAGAIDPKARSMQFDDELMGQLIRFVSSHEVGHTLGLMHNYGASSTVPVEKLRDKAFVEARGHTPSIMDYARFNYVAQPEDGITEKGIFPRIGDYDRWAIQWGYRWLPQFEGPKAESTYLNQLIIDSLSHNKRLFFGNEFEAQDPRSQSEDLGDDAVLASTYGIKNLARILPQLKNWTLEPNEGYENLRMMYEQAYRQYLLYAAHVLKSIGGEYHTPKSVEETGYVFEPVPYEKQKKAMNFLDHYAFHIPAWFAQDSMARLTGLKPDIFISTLQSNMLSRLLGSGMLGGMIRKGQREGEKAYQATELLDDLKKSVWEELYNGKSIDLYRRNLQKTYVDLTFNSFKAVNELVGKNYGNGVQIYVNPDPTKSDVSSLIRAHLLNLKKDIGKGIRSQKGLSKYHLQDMMQRIDDQLSVK